MIASKDSYDTIHGGIKHTNYFVMTYHAFSKTFGDLENLYGITIGLTIIVV
jgi:hypothetical protein